MVNRKPAVFLDRDGVINRAILVNGLPTTPTTVEEIEVLYHVKDSISRLNLSNFIVVVITNQPDVARGVTSRNQTDMINGAINDLVGIKHSYICYHDNSDNCSCRKPNPGNIFKAASDLNIDLDQSYMVGDRWRDIHAGQEAGCTCFFINHGYPERAPMQPYFEVESLKHAVNLILSGEFNGKIQSI
jgi:D-glycero-D-manno-heptose 1,7-bisphosphate phosphatase